MTGCSRRSALSPRSSVTEIDAEAGNKVFQPQVDGAHHKHVRKLPSTRPPKTRLKKLAAACETCAGDALVGCSGAQAADNRQARG